MGYKEYKKAIKLIDMHKDIVLSSNGCNENLIYKAEKKLNLKITGIYRDFLRKYGFLSFGSEEIYGIVDDNFEKSSIPDAIWYTIKQRKEANIPNSLLIIYHTGGDEVFCLNFNNINNQGDPNIISYIPGVQIEIKNCEIIYEDFGTFLLDRVNMELNNISYTYDKANNILTNTDKSENITTNTYNRYR